MTKKPGWFLAKKNFFYTVYELQSFFLFNSVNLNPHRHKAPSELPDHQINPVLGKLARQYFRRSFGCQREYRFIDTTTQ